MIDIHSHILAKIDDGSKSMDMSMEMARIYVKSGISKVIATPHYMEGIYLNSLEERKAKLKDLKENLKKEDIDLKVYLGNEIYVSMNMLDDLEKKKASTLNDSRYVLIELPMHDIPLYVEDMFYELQIKGYVPVIAHPERNTKIVDNPNILYEFIKQGCLTQMNLPSLRGMYGKAAKDTAKIMLEHRMVHFTGVDAHRDEKRSPRVAKALERLGELVSIEDFNDITYLNGKNLLEDKEIKINQPKKYKEKKSFFGFLRKSN